MIMKWFDQIDNEFLDQLTLNEPWHIMRPMDENGMRLGSDNDHENQWMKCDLDQMRPITTCNEIWMWMNVSTS